MLVVVTFVVLFQSGCQQETQAQEALRIENRIVTPALRVVAINPQRTEIVEPIFATGTVLAHKTTDLVPLVGGMVEEILVSVGDRVEKNQPLLRMRQRDFEIKVERLRQAVRLASAERNNARIDLDSAVALVQKGGLSQEQRVRRSAHTGR